MTKKRHHKRRATGLSNTHLILKLQEENRILKAELEHCKKGFDLQSVLLKEVDEQGKINFIESQDAPMDQPTVIAPYQLMEEARRSIRLANASFPMMNALANFESHINWINGFMMGFRAMNRLELAQAALDGFVGKIGEYRDEVTQKALAVSPQTAESARSEIGPIALSYQNALTNLLNNGAENDLIDLATRYTLPVMERIRTQWSEMDRGGRASGPSEENIRLGIRIELLQGANPLLAHPDIYDLLETELLQDQQDSEPAKRIAAREELLVMKQTRITAKEGSPKRREQKADFVQKRLADLRKSRKQR